MNEPFKYPGDELTLFHHAKHWKKYFSSQIKPYIKGRVLEAGAGLGSTSPFLNDGSSPEWVLLEPDPAMGSLLRQKVDEKILAPNSTMVAGTIEQVTGTFDTIIYIDVLEHIDADKLEISRAANLLNPGGHIIILVPAFQYLYSPFDKAVGHFRRYSRKTLRGTAAPGLQIISNRYYDSIGYFASCLNKWLLHQQYPTLKQVLFWDRWMVPVSRIADIFFFHSFGKSIISISRKSS